MSYEDGEFPPGQGCIGAEAWNENGGRVAFMRPAEYADSPVLIADGVEAGDIIQGGLGDCWFLGGLSVVATRPDLLRRVLPESLDSISSGRVQFHFFKFGEWHDITIDTRVPVGQNGPLFASGKDPNETWVTLIEKAYAKLHNDYSALIGGWVTDALCDMVAPAVPLTIYFDKIADEIASGAFWDRLLHMHASGQYLMGCAKATSGQREVDTGMGILGGHAYGVIDVREAGGHRLIRARNPWGCSEWKGRFSDGDSAWTDELREELNQVDADDGAFWIEYDDFVEQYGKVYAARIFDDSWNQYRFKSRWSGSNAGGCCNHSTWVNNEQYIFTVEEESEVVVSLQMRDPRQTGDSSNYIGFSVFKSDGSKVEQYRKPVLQSAIANQREAVEEAVMLPGTYAMMPFTFEPNQELEYIVSLYSRSNLEVTSTEGVAMLPEIPADAGSSDSAALAPSAPVVGGDDFDDDTDGPPQRGTTDIPRDDPGVVSPEIVAIANKLKKMSKYTRNINVEALNVALAKGDAAAVAKACCTLL